MLLSEHPEKGLETNGLIEGGQGGYLAKGMMTEIRTN